MGCLYVIVEIGAKLAVTQFQAISVGPISMIGQLVVLDRIVRSLFPQKELSCS